jgi:hypothetical protein
MLAHSAALQRRRPALLVILVTLNLADAAQSLFQLLLVAYLSVTAVVGECQQTLLVSAAVV